MDGFKGCTRVALAPARFSWSSWWTQRCPQGSGVSPGASYQDPTPSSPLTSETENTKDKKRKFRHKYSKMNVNYWLHSNHWFYLNTFLITTQSSWAQVRGRTWVVRWSSASLRGNVLALRHEKSREAFIVWLHSITSGTLTSPLIPPLVYITVVSLIP